MRPSVNYVTLTVLDLDSATRFYTEVLGFAPHLHYEPTRWTAFAMEGAAGFAIIEGGPDDRPAPTSTVDFFVDDIEPLWQRLRDRVPVVTPLAVMPWGSYKFVVSDPDGNRLGFVERS